MRTRYLALAAAVAISIIAACGGHHDALPPAPGSNTGELPMTEATNSPAPPSLPATQLTLPDYTTGGIIVAPDGAVYLNGYTGFIRYSSGAFTRYQYPVPAGAARAGGVDGQNTITTGPSGTVWSTLYTGSCCPTVGRPFVASLTASSGSIAESSGGALSGDAFDTIAPDGLNHLWVIHQTGAVCSNARYDITVFNSTLTPLRHITLPTTARLNAMTRGPDGMMYVATTLACGTGTPQIFQVDPSTFAIRKTVALSSGSSVKELTPGPDGAVWFTNYTGNSIGRLTSTGALANYPLPTRFSLPTGITLGSDGALWFSEEISRSVNNFKIGRITTAGAITEFLVPYRGAFLQASEITGGAPGGARIPHTLYVLPRGSRMLLKVTI